MKHHHHRDHEMKQNNRVIFGIFLILFGCLLVLKNLDVFPYYMKGIIFSWPALLLGLGALFYVGKKDKTTGIILMGVGGLFLLPIIFDWGFNWRGLFWPVILILIGVVIIRKRNECLPNGGKAGESGSGYIDELNVFGGGEKVINTKDFKGGKVTCVFGGSEINLTNADLAEGTNVIDVFAMFGGCVLILPSDWDVKVEVSAILGGVSDKRMPTTNYVVEPKKELIIKGFVALGGCEIKSYK
ncbi:LiaF transmembrane domain-containing protein [Marinifilum sp.]|uniref:LiaF transmembrane domain-containing protein n=1 Tax=Marinifilum sp. TaxID=2033137 RepID=UPI003BAB2AC1